MENNTNNRKQQNNKTYNPAKPGRYIPEFTNSNKPNKPKINSKMEYQEELTKRAWLARLIDNSKMLYYRHRHVLLQKMLVLLILFIFWHRQFWYAEIPVFWVFELLNLFVAFSFQCSPRCDKLWIVNLRYLVIAAIAVELLYVVILTFFLFNQWVIYLLLVVNFIQSYYLCFVYRSYYFQKVILASGYTTIINNEIGIMNPQMVKAAGVNLV